MNTISPKELHAQINSNQNCLILDVRTPAEFQEAHIFDSKNIELSTFTGKEECLTCHDRIVVVCKGGVRAGKACQKIPEEILSKTYVLDGGLDSWIANGFDVVKLKPCRFSMMQQVQIIVGVCVTIGSFFALTVSKAFAIIPLLFGCGLTLAGLTGICMLLKVPSKMPWNKVG